MKKTVVYSIFVLALFCMRANANVVFDFNSGPQYTSLPLTLTVGGITANFSATGSGYSIQNTAQVIGVLPTGFSGLGLVPNSVFSTDLMVVFPNQTLTQFSIMVAPQELATDSSATLKVTSYMNGVLVGSNTSQATGDTFTWPSSTLSFSSAAGFNSVLVQYYLPPPTGGDYGSIFVADNMIVTASSSSVPEPSTFALVGSTMLGLSCWRAHLKRRGQHEGRELTKLNAP